MGKVNITKQAGTGWGGLYWQYFENIDKIKKDTVSNLSITKKVYLLNSQKDRESLTEVTESTILKTGDLLKVRIEVRADRRFEYVHLKDLRASGLEPINTLSSYKYQDGLGYYENVRDVSTHFFIENLEKGIYLLEYPLRVAIAGNFSNGISTIECLYAPEFKSHSSGSKINIVE